jgi:poly-gamma-glutamate capsule biosynthesis protein CapA/YwtB (metallophosphatase superfamily)
VSRARKSPTLNKTTETVDGGRPHRPRSVLHSHVILFFLFYFLFFGLSSCQPQPPSVTLAFLGDVNLGRGVSPASDSLAFLTSELRAADRSLANLESPLSIAGPYGRSGAAPVQDGFNLCAPAGRAPMLADWGLDLLSLANNHALDCGADGLAQTRAALASAGLTPILPGGESVVQTVNGLRLAFLAFDDVSTPLDANTAVGAIRTARTNGAVVVVAVHWGQEYHGGADERQVDLAHQFAKAGAALVWGSHPHVLQPAEWIETGAGKTLVLYSLGNALFDQPGLPDTRRSALVVVELDARGVQTVRAVPFIIDTAGSRLIAPDAATAAIIHDNIHIP